MVVIAGITVVLAATAPVIAHGVNHALFAHDAGKLDGKDSSKFVGKSSGLILYSVMGPWDSAISSTEIVEDPAYETVVTNATSGAGYVILQAPMPVAQYGKRLRVLGVEVCFDSDENTGGDVTVTDVSVRKHEWLPEGGHSQFFIAGEDTNSTGAECRVVKSSSGTVLRPQDMAAVELSLNWADDNEDPFYISRTTFILKATNQTARAPS
jgi:hypothetical protein